MTDNSTFDYYKLNAAMVDSCMTQCAGCEFRDKKLDELEKKYQEIMNLLKKVDTVISKYATNPYLLECIDNEAGDTWKEIKDMIKNNE